jgi:nitrogenase molybdenum-iron protein alpha/beta subunit
VPGKSLSGDWLDGYGEMLQSIASQIDLSGGCPRSEKLAIVGYLFDRNEQDHVANVRELRRLSEAAGFDLVSVWLSGQTTDELRELRNAGTIVSLPYGRKAARKAAKRTGARLIELELPFGLHATEQWVRTLAEVSGHTSQAEAFIEAELAEVIPRLEWAVPFVFQNRSMGFIGDPHLLAGVKDLVETVGARLDFAVITNRAHHVHDAERRFPGLDLLVYPRQKELMSFLTRRRLGGPPALTIANNAGILDRESAVLEFGFPSYFRHALYDRPFLGFAGALATLDSMANAIRWQEVQVTLQNMR